jgi:two-component system response regulator YesN
MPAVLFVDDEHALRRAAQRWLGRKGITVHTAHDVRDAKRYFRLYRLDGAFIDLWLGDGTGVELLAWIKENYPALAPNVVFLTGDIVADRRAAELERPLLTKPFDLAELEHHVGGWMQSSRRRELEERARPGAI